MAGRTFFIAQPQPTALAAALDTVKDDIVVATPPTNQVDTWFDFIDQLSTAPQGRRYTMWMACNSLNNFIIANLQAHLRAEDRLIKGEQEVNRSVEHLARQGLDQKGIDEFNEQMAAFEQIRAASENHTEQGFEEPVPPLDVAESLINIRSYIAAGMLSLAKSPRDAAQSIADSIAFRLSKMPVVDDKKVMAIHIATQIPLEALRKADLQIKLSDRKQLIEQAGRIIDLSKELAWKGLPADAEVESVFDKLPVQTRYRLIGSTVRALKLAMDAEVKALIRFGRMDSVTNRVLIDNVMQGYVTFFNKFTHDNGDALHDYEMRGYALPTLDELLADKE